MPAAPDFVLLGVQMGDGVAIYASTKLTDAELRSETSVEVDAYHPLAHVMTRLRPGRTLHFISATMKEYVVAFGPTYADAFRYLMQTWQPDPDERPALPNIRALEP